MATKKATRPSHLRNEILALIFFTSACAVLLSLVSYHPQDPSLSFYASKIPKVRNWLGFAGSYLSDALYQALGLSALCLVVILSQCAFRLFLYAGLPFRIMNCVGWVGIIGAGAGLLDLGVEKVSFRGATMLAGGVLGDVIAQSLSAYLNVLGAYLALGLVLLISFMVSTRFSVLRGGRQAKAMLLTMGAGLGNLRRKDEPLEGAATDREGKASKIKDEPVFFGHAEGPAQDQAKEPTIVTPAEKEAAPTPHARFQPREEAQLSSEFRLPPLSLLQDHRKEITTVEREALLENARVLESKLQDYGVQAKVTNVHPGPVITLYELEPAPGVKINRIVNLGDDLALALRALGIRIIAPIPGKAAIGVEIPNRKRETVYFKEIVSREEFQKNESPLTIGLGKDTSGKVIVADLAAMPHLLIAGTTGSGKSVFINATVCSILYKALPSEVKLLIMDPKRSELTFYRDIPHLLYPVVSDAKQAAEALRWAVEEMERRYQVLARMGTRDIKTYNQKVTKSPSEGRGPAAEGREGEDLEPLQPMPWIVVVIDELANLMMVSSREVEWSLARLAQMARAAGIHLLVATQRPTVDIITGTIKANFPARISFRLAARTDSRVIIDNNGAENLLNQGDMLFLSPRTGRLRRIQGPYISDEEISATTNFLKAQARPEYQELRLEVGEEEDFESTGEDDEKYQEAVTLVTSLGQASISLVQRKLRIGYNRAARIIEKMEEDGIVGPSDGVKPREVLRRMVDV